MKIKVTILLLASIALSGCVALLAAGAAGSLIVYDSRPIGVIEKDARIYHVISNNIANDPKFSESHIVVTSFNQVVLLAGQTNKASNRVLAEKIAKNTPNVVRVYNEITIGEPTALSTRSHDAWITGQVRAKMIAKKDLQSGSIRIVTEDSVVYVMGIATHSQANLAASVAREVPGVKKVVKIFRYIQ